MDKRPRRSVNLRRQRHNVRRGYEHKMIIESAQVCDLLHVVVAERVDQGVGREGRRCGGPEGGLFGGCLFGVAGGGGDEGGGGKEEEGGEEMHWGRFGGWNDDWSCWVRDVIGGES